MKKLVAIVSMFAFMAAAVSTQAMSSAAGSGSSSGGSSGGSRSSSNNGSKIVPSPIISDPAPVIGSDTDPAPSPIGDILCKTVTHRTKLRLQLRLVTHVSQCRVLLNLAGLHR